MIKRIIENSKGQIAIFIVLIFSVLFILFGMTLNVAMTVYDKINFQNALDFATYYGAKQQAEVLNAMAHINYQMRQNWKLLSWRYRILGNLTQNEGYHKDQGQKDYWCPQNRQKTVTCDFQRITKRALKTKCSEADRLYNKDQNHKIYFNPRRSDSKNYCDYRYFVCISSNAWIRGINKKDDQNLCKTEGVDIPPIPDPAIPGGPLGVPQLASRAIIELRNQMNSSCPMEGALNALLAHLFLISFMEDQLDRKEMMEGIWNKTLNKRDKMNDLDGNPILDGAHKVFWHNLSRRNQKSIEKEGKKEPIEFSFNTIKGKQDDKKFDQFFEPIRVLPVLQVLDFESNGNNDPTPTSCSDKVRLHYDNNINYQKIITRLTGHPLGQHLRDSQYVKDRMALFSNDPGAFFHKDNELLLGYRKIPDKIIYYGLTKQFDYAPNSLFDLPNGVWFKASALAKPFGGVFGPGLNADRFIPEIPNRPGDIDLSEFNPFFNQPNYSRYPGDPWGLVEYSLHDGPDSFLNKISSQYKYKRAYSMDAFFLWNLYPDDSKPRDPLAWPFARSPSSDPSQSFMRMMELVAIYPDVFDLSHYSIAGNYMETFFPRICKLLSGQNCDPYKNNKAQGGGYYIRGDLGWPYPDVLEKNDNKLAISIAPIFLRKNSPSDQINQNEIKVLAYNPQHFPHSMGQRFKTIGPSMSSNPSPPTGQAGLTRGNHFGYNWLATFPPPNIQDLKGPETIFSILSSWAPAIPKGEQMDYSDYNLEYKKNDPGKLFMRCHAPVRKKDRSNTSGCIAGGRSGYSVKLISCNVLGSFPGRDRFYCSQ